MFKSLFKKKQPSKGPLWDKILSEPFVEGTYGDQTLYERVKKKTGWSMSKVKEVAHEYKKFLYLAATNDQVVPSAEVDEIWHEHILFTKDYFGRWSVILGKTLHHNPEIIGKKNDFSTGYVETRKKYQEEFSSSDNSAAYWPLIASTSDSPACPPDTSHATHSAPAVSHDCSPAVSHDSSPAHSCGSSGGHSCGSSCGGSSCGGGGGCGGGGD